ncbi:pectinesterase family protein [Wenyingzhuangia sp. chi5]|uniref:Pectinesterase n=1 Tax=Wenyingzhuangia gilva TaxID=3057677 RepID=A0ABT8VSY7_9FLAO|nr:pectinesterase family protein [Wenyingzhuangia sp. chi5]MDO3695089.1 pectinesterase family protein [Wenyingzhuangia sp. chi5]
MKNSCKILRILCFIIISGNTFAQKEKVDIRPYTIETTYNKLKKYYDFISPIALTNSEDVLVDDHIVYKKTTTSNLELDVFYPKQHKEKKLPGVLLVHGGGWVSGERENLSPLAEKLAEHGYVAVVASYRLGPEAIYPAAMLDLKDALRWMKEHSEKYHLDVNRIASLGGSAGAHLAMQLGVTPNSKIYKEENEKTSTSIQAIVNIDGVASFVHPETGKGALLDFWLGGTFKDSLEVWKEASPLEHVTKNTPPTIFINSAQPRFHAGRDTYVELLDRYRIYNEVHTLPNTPHSFWLMNPWFETTLRYTVDFLDKMLKDPYKEPYKTITVAQDGTGEFNSIQEAVNSVRAFGPSEVLINIKDGVYREKIVIPSFMHKVTLKGQSKENTVITFDDYAGKVSQITQKKYGTFDSYTLLVLGADVHLENLTVKNESCHQGQAVALHVEGDRFVAKNCRIVGCQDTLYTATEGGRQYYEDCFIEGTTDFIFGQATVVFEKCIINSVSDSYITAAATPRNQEFGYVFFNCKLTSNKNVHKVYLGRPWRSYAKTVFINTEMGDHILPVGWHAWPGDKMFPNKEKTTFYAEYKSVGKGASPDTRVNWSHQLSNYELDKYTFKNIFKGWVPVLKE